MADISVIGLGKLGSPMVAWFASKGYNVIGVDQDTKKVHLLNEKYAPVLEPGLANEIALNSHRIEATTDLEKAVLNSRITFIVVPTPSGKDGAFLLEYVEAAATSIGQALAKKTEYHLVVITSTVMPGHSRKIVGILERESGRKCGESLGVCYNPEFIALGSVLYDLDQPDFVLIGESDYKAGDVLDGLYFAIYNHSHTPYAQVPIRRMSFESAEVAKLALNVMLVQRIVYAGVLADICQDTPGANVDHVTEAIGLDSRIGPKLLKAGPIPGGPCLPRDTRALYSVSFSWFLSGLQTQLQQWPGRMFNFLVGMPDRFTIGVLGLAYKPGSHIFEDSPGLALARSLVIFRNITVVGYDPLVDTVPELTIKPLHEVLAEADALYVMLPLPELKGIDWAQVKACRVIDLWRYLDAYELREAGIEVVSYGRNFEYYE